MTLLARTRATTYRRVGVTVLALLVASGVNAGAASGAPQAVSAQSWNDKISKVAAPSPDGCFTARYPQLRWSETACAQPPAAPMRPKPRIRPLTIGSGNDISAETPGGNITDAFGSFENVSGVTSVSSPITDGGAPVSNAYSLQLNTNYLTTTACAGGSALCQGWEQFVYATNGTSGLVFIQYWLLQYNAACPGGWMSFSFPGDTDIYCYRNSVAVGAPNAPITNLANLRVSGSVTATTDRVVFSDGVTAVMTPGVNAVNASAGWTIAEFNVFGYCCSGQAVFNAGATTDVRTRINYGGSAAPRCAATGFTGETNSLNFGTTPPPVTPPGPAVFFTENTAGGAVTNCTIASVIGDTHQQTFSGLLYDFQASGDFVEAQLGSDFEVQTRKMSGAPTWPNTSVNQSVAAKMGTTKVAVCSPERLVVNGQGTQLPPGGSMSVAGVSIHRVGNVYYVIDQAGNSIKATFNSGYLDVAVGLGTWPAKVRGLLGNPDGDVRRLEAKDGTQFTVPVSFDDLYRRFGDSWRVNPLRSLLSPCSAVASGTPSAPFFAANLDTQLREWAQTTCRRAGVDQAWLDTCTLDAAVVGERAVAIYVGRTPPVLNGNQQ